MDVTPEEQAFLTGKRPEIGGQRRQTVWLDEWGPLERPYGDVAVSDKRYEDAKGTLDEIDEEYDR
jgi:hypothetical protein